MSLESWALTSLHGVLSFLERRQEQRQQERVTTGPHVTRLDRCPDGRPEPEPSTATTVRLCADLILQSLRDLNQTAGLILDAIQVPLKPVRVLGHGGDRNYESVLVAALLRPGQSVEAKLELPKDWTVPGVVNWRIEGPVDAIVRFPDPAEGDSQSFTGLCTVGSVTLQPGIPRRIIISRLSVGQAPITYGISH